MFGPLYTRRTSVDGPFQTKHSSTVFFQRQHMLVELSRDLRCVLTHLNGCPVTLILSLRSTASYTTYRFIFRLSKDTGLALLPAMFTLGPGSIVTGILVTRYHNCTYPIWIGWVVTTLVSGLTIPWDETTHTATWIVILLILGLGHGAILNAQNFATQALCDAGQEGRAASMYAFLRQFGMAVGVGVGGSVFQNTMSTKLAWEGLSTDIAANSK